LISSSQEVFQWFGYGSLSEVAAAVTKDLAEKGLSSSQKQFLQMPSRALSKIGCYGFSVLYGSIDEGNLIDFLDVAWHGYSLVN